ncbi:AER176Wp, putative, partial [Ixodes scapularis]
SRPQFPQCVRNPTPPRRTSPPKRNARNTRSQSFNPVHHSPDGSPTPAVTPAGAGGPRQPIATYPPPPFPRLVAVWPPHPERRSPRLPPSWSAPLLQPFVRPSRRFVPDPHASPRWRSPSPPSRTTTRITSSADFAATRDTPGATGPAFPSRTPRIPTPTPTQASREAEIATPARS